MKDPVGLVDLTIMRMTMTNETKDTHLKLKILLSNCRPCGPSTVAPSVFEMLAVCTSIYVKSIISQERDWYQDIRGITKTLELKSLNIGYLVQI